MFYGVFEMIICIQLNAISGKKRIQKYAEVVGRDRKSPTLRQAGSGAPRVLRP